METGVWCVLAPCRNTGTRAAYLENEDTKALFEVLMLLDDLCLKEKIVPPTGGQYLMRPRFPNDM
jgi:hypothetical protein